MGLQRQQTEELLLLALFLNPSCRGEGKSVNPTTQSFFTQSMLNGSTSRAISIPVGGCSVGSTARSSLCRVPGLGDWI